MSVNKDYQKSRPGCDSDAICKPSTEYYCT